MDKKTQTVIDKALKNQVDGTYSLKEAELSDSKSSPLFSLKLLGEMLSERPEFSSVHVFNDEIVLAVAPEYLVESIDPSKYRELDKDDVDIMLAKHMLYLRNAGGEQANFSGCLIKNMSLEHAVFNNAILNNAVFVDCGLSESDMTFVSAHGTIFKNCELSHIHGDEADFTYAKFTDCDLRQALTMHANYTGATFDHCNVERMLLEGCCLARTDWIETDNNVADTYRAVYSVEEYNSEIKTDDINME